QPERAVDFYTRVLGWEFQKWEGPEDYWLISTGPVEQPGINGGMLRRRGAVDGTAVIAHLCTVDVSDVDEPVRHGESARRLTALQKAPVPGGGWLAYAKDTGANMCGMMQLDRGAR